MDTKEDKNQNKMLQEALNYLNRGWPIIPINPSTKKPILKSWKEYQKRLPTKNEIITWWTQWPWANIALVTGKLSGVNVVDIDPRHGGTLEGLTPTVFSQTGGGGWHAFYLYKIGLFSKNGLRAGVDFKTDGGYVILPPSIHARGNPYKWYGDSYKNNAFSELPEEIYQLFTIKKNNPLQWQESLSGTSEGNRNQTAASITGKLLSLFPKEQWEAVCWPLLKGWNLQNKPEPLPEEELRSVFNSISKAETSKSESQSIYTNDQLTNYKLELISSDELLNKVFPPNKWLVDHLVPENGITCISGKPKAGKSFLTLDLALSLATGNTFLGQYETLQSNVLFISKEDPQRLIKERLTQLTSDNGLPIYFLTDASFFLDTDVYLKETINIIKQRDIKVIIIDSFRRIFKGEENSSQIISDIHSKFKILLDLGVSIIFIHHHSKDGFFKKEGGDKLRGSSDILAMLDSLLIVERKNDNIIKISQAALRSDRPINPAIVSFPSFTNNDNRFIFKDYVVEETEKLEKAKEDIIRLINTGSFSQKEIINQLTPVTNYSATTIKNALSQLVELKNIDFIIDGTKKIYVPLYRIEGQTDEIE